MPDPNDVSDPTEKRPGTIVSPQSDPLFANALRALREGSDLAVFEAPLRTRLAQDPDHPVALFLMGESLRIRRALDSAEPYLRRAIEVAPESLEAHAALARLLHEQCRAPDALEALQPILDRKPGDLQALRYRAALTAEIGGHAEAADIYRRLLQHYPGAAAFWIGYGDAQRVLGNRGDAERAYRLGLGRAPRNGRLWWSLAAIRTRFTSTDIAAMDAALAGHAIEVDDRVHLHFALGSAHDQAGRYETAFAHFAEGNRLHEGAQPYDPAQTGADIAAIRRLHDRAFFAARSTGGAGEPDPIFVLGMPRSGSTLVEQILASHPLIEGTAELPLIPMLAMTLGGERGAATPQDYRALLGTLTPQERTDLGKRYLDRARAYRRTDRPYFIDKLPYNWIDIDLIQLTLPNARIIDVRRHPIDCCMSNFKLMFGQGHPSAYSLEGMAAYYRDYVALMGHFDTALPGRIHRLIYEQLVEDPETETRRLLDYIGVEFDPACLDFHKTERAVVTASSEQVRRPLNRDGIGAWRNYAPWIAPMVAALGDLPARYAE